MEKQKLQYSTLIYVLALISLPLCCCLGFGIVTAGIAFFIARSELKKYYENPDNYSNQDAIYTGKIIALVVLIINALYILYIIYTVYTVGLDELMRQSEEVMKNYQ
jgi:hypothetical protein